MKLNVQHQDQEIQAAIDVLVRRTKAFVLVVGDNSGTCLGYCSGKPGDASALATLMYAAMRNHDNMHIASSMGKARG